MIDLDTVKICAVIGDTDTGKTNLAVYHLRNYKGNRQIYTLGYPGQLDNYIPLNSLSDIFRLSNSIIFIDELSKVFPLKNRHTNNDFIEVARLLAHSGNTILFTTQLTQDLTNQMEAFVEGFLITKMADLRFLKAGSKVKYVIMDCLDPRRTSKELNLNQGEYLQSVDNSPAGTNGIRPFPFQNIGKKWRNSAVRAGAQPVALGGAACGSACGSACGNSSGNACGVGQVAQTTISVQGVT